MSKTISVAPPTQKQLDSFRAHMRRCLHVEHAAALAGIPSRVVTRWILLGRQGTPDFVEFVDIIDNESAAGASKLIGMVEQAISDGDLNSAKWLYQMRFRQRESRLTDKWLDLEEMAEADGTAAPREEDVAAAEARLLGEEELQ